MKLRFTKMHGAGNDFVVIDATREPFKPTPALLARLADRRFGVGCDQVLVVDPPSSGVDFNYRIYNSDGSESGQCLNGARCFARFVREQGLSDKNDIRIRTRASTMELHLLADGRVRINAGVPLLDPERIPFRAARAPRYTLTLADGSQVEIGAVGMGNPHAVMLADDVERAPVEARGKLLQRHAAFPESVNAGFLQVVDPSHAKLRVYERGAGETLACGSGACAAVVAGRLWGVLGSRVELQMPGGKLVVEWEGEGRPVWLTGPAVSVYTGEFEWQNS
ncbi:MAG TPA: diaminopimelate epimerase [Nevskiaceae bacterium]|nr:diaminopimelate epimerase [Nevskiaceae bacterium]